MQDLTVTLVQANQIWENKAANFENYSLLLENVMNTDLIVLPEMFNTGFSMNASELSEEFSDSLSLEWLKTLASKKNAAIYTSLMILENHRYYNRGVFVEPMGNVSFYDKRQLFSLAGEDQIFTNGTNATIVEYKGWKINLQICYDLRFPEISLNKEECGIANYDVAIYVANWPLKRVQHWNSLLVARAIENQCFVIGVNRVGIDGANLEYSGSSQVVDSLGCASVLGNYECCETITLSSDSLLEIRKNLPFLKDRKKENQFF